MLYLLNELLEILFTPVSCFIHGHQLDEKNNFHFGGYVTCNCDRCHFTIYKPISWEKERTWCYDCKKYDKFCKTTKHIYFNWIMEARTFDDENQLTYDYFDYRTGRLYRG